MAELTWLLGVVAAVTGVFGLGWWLKRPTTSRFLQEDLSSIVHETMCWAKAGATLHLYEIRSRRGISITKLNDPGDAQAMLRIAVHTEEADRASDELAQRLAILGLSEALRTGQDQHETHSLMLSGIPAPDTLGRIANLGLEAAGVSAGERIVHQFEGEIAMSAVREYRRTHLRRRLQQ